MKEFVHFYRVRIRGVCLNRMRLKCEALDSQIKHFSVLKLCLESDYVEFFMLCFHDEILSRELVL